MKKLYDICIKTGTYEKDGKTEGRYENVGCIMEKEEGKPFMMINRTFNPAGIANPENRSSALLSLFVPKDKLQDKNINQEDIAWAE